MTRQEVINILMSIETTLLNFEAAKLSAVDIDKWLYGLANKLTDMRLAISSSSEEWPAHPVTPAPPTTKRKYAMPRGDILEELDAVQIDLEEIEANLESTMDRISNLKIDAITTKDVDRS